MKIYSIEVNKKGFDDVSVMELAKMVGWTEFDTESKTWDVNCADGSTFECKTQEMAYLMASVEEIKAMLLETHKANNKSEESDGNQ